MTNDVMGVIPGQGCPEPVASSCLFQSRAGSEICTQEAGQGQALAWGKKRETELDRAVTRVTSYDCLAVAGPLWLRRIYYRQFLRLLPSPRGLGMSE